MSVIVKGMEMPKNCGECAFYIDGACYGKGYIDYCSIMDTAKPDDCPLVELPPHGRLGDLDELMTEFMDSDLDHLQRDDWREVIQIVADAPTVIEAEGSET